MQPGHDESAPHAPDSGNPARTADPTLASLAARAAAGDDAAFDTLYARLDGGLRRFLVRRGVAAQNDTEELAQSAWVDVWDALRTGRYDPSRSAITTFLYAVAYKLWLQHRRQQRSALARDADADSLTHLADLNGAAPAETMDLAERIEAVQACIRSSDCPAGLSSDEQSVVLALAEGESERSLAARLGVAASTVHARKSSAHHKIRTYLELRFNPPQDNSTRHRPSIRLNPLPLPSAADRVADNLT